MNERDKGMFQYFLCDQNHISYLGGERKGSPPRSVFAPLSFFPSTFVDTLRSLSYNIGLERIRCPSLFCLLLAVDPPPTPSLLVSPDFLATDNVQYTHKYFRKMTILVNLIM